MHVHSHAQPRSGSDDLLRVRVRLSNHPLTIWTHEAPEPVHSDVQPMYPARPSAKLLAFAHACSLQHAVHSLDYGLKDCN